MWRRKVLVVVAAGGAALAAFGLWHARASAQSECIWDCVETTTCLGSTTTYCSGCVAGMPEYCTNQQGRWTCSGVRIHGTTPGNKAVTWQMVYCGTHHPCIAQSWGLRYCEWSLGACSPTEPDPITCLQCTTSSEGIDYWASDAVCSTCPGGGT